MTKTICIDMDDVLCDYTGAYRKALSENPDTEFPQSRSGFFRGLRPLKGAIRSVEHLDSVPDFEVYVLTAPSERNPMCYTEKRLWVEDHLGMEMVPRLIISPDKGLIMGDYLIDDHTMGRGQENFRGRLLEFGSPEFPNWDTIMEYFGDAYKIGR